MSTSPHLTFPLRSRFLAGTKKTRQVAVSSRENINIMAKSHPKTDCLEQKGNLRTPRSPEMPALAWNPPLPHRPDQYRRTASFPNLCFSLLPGSRPAHRGKARATPEEPRSHTRGNKPTRIKRTQEKKGLLHPIPSRNNFPFRRTPPESVRNTVCSLYMVVRLPAFQSKRNQVGCGNERITIRKKMGKS